MGFVTLGHAMVEDVTDDVMNKLGPEVEQIIERLFMIYKIAPRVISQEMSHKSVDLVASYVQGSRVSHHNPGYDVITGDTKIEVKSRFQDRPLRTPSFNVSNTSRISQFVYFVVWWYPWEGTKTSLHRTLRIRTGDLIRTCSSKDPRYCAQTTLRQLERLIRS